MEAAYTIICDFDSSKNSYFITFRSHIMSDLKCAKIPTDIAIFVSRTMECLVVLVLLVDDIIACGTLSLQKCSENWKKIIN